MAQTPNTTWAPVKGWAGLYEFSDSGDVRSSVTRRGSRKGHILKKRWTTDGYVKVVLRRPGEASNLFVHRIVYEAFVGPIPEGMEIDHLDFNKANNSTANLEAVAKRTNIQRSFLRGRNLARGSRQGRASFTENDVTEILQRSMAGEKQVNLAKEYGVTPTAIYCIVKRKTWAHVELPK
jgi:hypothetical protein